VVKKRSGNHERTIRECKVQKGGLFVGEPLHDFQGVLTGVPRYIGSATPLLENSGGNGEGIRQQSSEAGDHAEDGAGEHGRKRRRKKASR